MIYTLPTERLPEWETERLVNEIRDANIWYFPLRKTLVEKFRLPSGSRILGIGNDDQGRQSLRVQVPDALAEYESAYLVYQSEVKPYETLLRNDNRVKYIGTRFVDKSEPYREYFLAYVGHPVVQRGLTQ